MEEQSDAVITIHSLCLVFHLDLHCHWLFPSTHWAKSVLPVVGACLHLAFVAWLVHPLV